jgi:hypothetical protein
VVWCYLFRELLLDALDIVLDIGLINTGLEEPLAVGNSPLSLLGNSGLLLLDLGYSCLHIRFGFTEERVVGAHFLVERREQPRFQRGEARFEIGKLGKPAESLVQSKFVILVLDSDELVDFMKIFECLFIVIDKYSGLSLKVPLLFRFLRCTGCNP